MTAKKKLPGVTLQDHALILKKKRPDIYAALKHPDPHINLAWNTLVLRRKYDLTQGELARRAGVTSRTIHSIENINSGYNPTLDVIIGLAKALGTKPEHMIENVDLAEKF
jgi:DNA-binding XRE family transcriptional regulator